MLLLRNKKSIKGYGSRTWVPYPPFPLHTHAVHRFRTVMVVFVGSYTVFICSFRPVFTRSVLHFSSCLAHNSTHTHTLPSEYANLKVYIPYCFLEQSIRIHAICSSMFQRSPTTFCAIVHDISCRISIACRPTS